MSGADSYAPAADYLTQNGGAVDAKIRHSLLT